jgi:hypothetical protein
MKADGQQYLELLAAFPPRSFERDFSKTSTRLGLGGVLAPDELKLLLDATFYAGLCNIAFNGLGGCGGEIRPDRERNRMRLEQAFMAARAAFFACRGWTRLSPAQKGAIQRIFLLVKVNQENLAE